MDLTLTIPDELATRLRAVEDRLPEILELGLREWLSTPPGYAGLNEVLETLARLPTAEEILALRPTATASKPHRGIARQKPKRRLVGRGAEGMGTL